MFNHKEICVKKTTIWCPVSSNQFKLISSQNNIISSFTLVTQRSSVFTSYILFLFYKGFYRKCLNHYQRIVGPLKTR